MKYEIILYDFESKAEEKTLKCYKTQAKAIKAVKKLRSKGLPAFYKKGGEKYAELV